MKRTVGDNVCLHLPRGNDTVFCSHSACGRGACRTCDICTGLRAGSSDEAVRISYDRIKTNEDRVKFLSQFGYEVSEDPIETVEITLPEKFDKVYAGYNELQKAQGLDLSKYRRKTVMRYTYEVKNYDGYNGGKVLANVIVYRGRVIGGDVCSADPQGFVHGFEGAIKMQ